MLAVFIKELNTFLNSLIAYVVITVFLLTTGLFMWIFPETNVLDNAYATIDTLFFIAPWVLMFLAPAITMRFFSEEKKSGTIELILTRPVNDLKIVLGKYFAGFTLLLFAVFPTIVYYFSVYHLGTTVGNIDSGSVWGSYIGLLLLGGSYVAIGIFASSLSENQVVSFIIAVFLCFFCYSGFDSVSSLKPFGNMDNFIAMLGFSAHYNSISRGVVDTRDILYFLSVIYLFILFTQTALGSRKW